MRVVGDVTADRSRVERALRLEHSRGEGRRGVVRQHGHGRAHDDRAGVIAVVDDVDGRAGLVCAAGEHGGMDALAVEPLPGRGRHLGQQRGVDVEDAAVQLGRNDELSQESGEEDQLGVVRADRAIDRIAVFLVRGEIAALDDGGGDPGVGRDLEPTHVRFGTDDDADGAIEPAGGDDAEQF